MLTARMRAFLRDEAGATAIEYALVATLVAVAAAATFAVAGNSLRDLYNNGASDIIASQAEKL